MSLAASRREFLRRASFALSAAAAAPAAAMPRAARAARKGPHERLNLGIIGCSGRARGNIAGVEGENLVALCDIDERHLGEAAAKFPKADRYADYRKLLDRRDLDAVVISTPDHTHAIPTVWALMRGLDVYCEKPLTHSVYECRKVRQWTAKQKAVTQMGTQIHAGDNYRRVVELIRAGVLGTVQHVHVVHPGDFKPGRRAAQGTPPPGVDYDLWTGPAPMRPFDPSHFHFNWRFWWDYGNGTLGDLGCHYMDLPFWALDLREPSTVEARGQTTHGGENDIPDTMRVDYTFPARGDRPALSLTWWQGQWRPEGSEEFKKSAFVLFEGERGRLLADYSTRQLFLEPGLSAETPEPSIPASIGHHAEWIEACKTRGPTTCNFDYSGALTEAVLLGNVSYRAAGQRLEWDAEALRAPNVPEADAFIRREYRSGWTLEG